MEKKYNYNVCTRAQSESMCHVGMNRDVTRDAVQKNLTLGKKYCLKSVNTTSGDTPKAAVCELLMFNNTMAVFKHKNGTLESFTYQDLWKQMMDGDFI